MPEPSSSPMVARVWTARATPERAARYQEHLVHDVLPALRQLEGYVGASLLVRADGDQVELVVLTRWTSMESIRAFAGPDLERAVVAPEAGALLTSWDQRVRHYRIAVSDDRQAP
jgi:heme-degrading monooxygenase HmoA